MAKQSEIPRILENISQEEDEYHNRSSISVSYVSYVDSHHNTSDNNYNPNTSDNHNNSNIKIDEVEDNEEYNEKLRLYIKLSYLLN